MSVEVPAATRLRGVVRTPGDKSISHRAVLLSAMAEGSSSIVGCSTGLDVVATTQIVEQLGAIVDGQGTELEINGARGLRPSDRPLDCGNSGTTIRLLTGWLAGLAGSHRLVGDASLSRRPMDRVARPLSAMGLRVEGHGERVTPPLTVTRGVEPLRAIDYEVPEPSAQVKSAVVFAGLFADGVTTVRERVRTRANTEEMLAASGVSITTVDDGDGRVVTVTPGRPAAHAWRVPGDPSQAAFFVVLGLVHPDAELTVPDLYGAPERNGFLAVLERMGGALERSRDGELLSVVARSSQLVATEIDASDIPSVDEVPALAVAAAAAEGTTRFREVAELRVKESDRFAGTVALVRALGARADADGDDLVVHGVGAATRFTPFYFDGGLDHRMAMAAAVAATAGTGATLDGTGAIATSYPGFFADLASLR